MPVALSRLHSSLRGWVRYLIFTLQSHHMERRKFFRNLIGTLAAVTIGKRLAPLLSNPVEQSVLQSAASLPGTGGRLFTVVFNPKWYTAGDILLGSNTRQYYLTKCGDNVIGIDIEDPERSELLIIPTDESIIKHNSHPNQILTTKLCSVQSEY